MTELSPVKSFEFKEMLGKWKFLEKDPMRERKFIILLRKYKHFLNILQADPKEYNNVLTIKIEFQSFSKEVKFLKDEIKIFFEKTSKTQLEQGLVQLKDDLLEILDIFISRYELSSKEIQLKHKEYLMSLNQSQESPLQSLFPHRDEEDKTSINSGQNERISPKIKALRKTSKNMSHSHANENHGRQEKGYIY